MSAELKNLKGTGDYLPQEQSFRQDIVRKLTNVFEIYGYQPLETPIICYFDLLASKYAGGAEILKEIYQLSDQGGRELALRYDLTVPLARVVGMNPELRMPFKRYEIGKVYRDGPIKTGRKREFIQCDVDIVGTGSFMAEAELLSMTVEVFRLLGLDVCISYSNRKLLSGIIEAAGIKPELWSSVILVIDKLEKKSEAEIQGELEQLGIEKNEVNSLFSLLKMTSNQLAATLSSQSQNSLAIQGFEEIEKLNEFCEVLCITDRLKFTPSLARGLEIYTGTVWEVFLKDGRITSSVAAGGRYDKIIGKFLDNGNDYPAVGMTFGLDVIYEALMLKNPEIAKPPVDLYMIPLGTEKDCLKIADGLRKQGIKVDVDMSGRKLKKSLDYANKQKIPSVLIIGENELKEGKARLKRMIDGSEREIILNEASFFLDH